ncbi:RsmB/NOP family class I SAM-dependent RNA methyltransferase [Trichocoleus desertorum AS-A10]|uniref:RsmB/NOP family class I SAM-dependent RNA methyltransferase n=1 Tax=Trichocoleus desertorum TaxID=1481672 RepID=UPI003296B7F5
MEKPSNLLVKFSQRLFKDEVYQEKFINALVNPQPFNPAILWCQAQPEISPFKLAPPTLWQPNFIERLVLDEKPGKHPLHDAGNFYCLDFSSIFAASTLLTIEQPVDLILDMCASPGGKSVFAWTALQPRLLISNEVIGKRKGALISNLKRCHISPAIALSLDSQVLAELIPNTAQLVLVDAPCTGQSLLAKGSKAPGCFHPILINKNANRQKRILANSAKLVAPQGYLAYMTCAYSPEENEQVSEWFLAKFPQFQALVVPHLVAAQSHLTDIPCYRMWPHSGLGAGAFTILFKNMEEGSMSELPTEFLERSDFIYL